MLRCSAGFSFFTLAAAAMFATSAGAQQLRGPGEDATSVPKGTFRLGVDGQWSIFSDTYGPGGILRPLGASLSTDSLGANTLSSLLPLQTTIRALAGSSAINLSLGKTLVSRNSRIQSTSIGLEYGLSRRIQIGVTVPVVKTRSSIFVTANPAGNQGNLAINPASPGNTFYSADTAFIQQLGRAAAAVEAYCAGVGSATTECANGSALASSATTFGNGLQEVYADGSLVPTAQSDVQVAIDARATGFRSALNAFAAIPGSGVPEITALGVIGAAPLTTSGLQAIVREPTIGFGADSISTIERIHLGDIELAAKILLLDSFGGDEKARMHPTGLNARLAIGASYRLPTGSVDDPNNFADVPTGTHEAAVGTRAFVDVLLGRHFWTSVVVRNDFALGTDVLIRIPDSTLTDFLPNYRRATVHRKSGNFTSVEATPRWAFNEFVSLSAQYMFRHKQADQYTGDSFVVGPSIATGGATLTLSPSAAELNTDFTEHRVGGGFAFSNVRAASEGRARLPFEVSYMHWQTVKGSGGSVPKMFGDQIQLRVYTKLWGR